MFKCFNFGVCVVSCDSDILVVMFYFFIIRGIIYGVVIEFLSVGFVIDEYGFRD